MSKLAKCGLKCRNPEPVLLALANLVALPGIDNRHFGVHNLRVNFEGETILKSAFRHVSRAVSNFKWEVVSMPGGVR